MASASISSALEAEMLVAELSGKRITPSVRPEWTENRTRRHTGNLKRRIVADGRRMGGGWEADGRRIEASGVDGCRRTTGRNVSAPGACLLFSPSFSDSRTNRSQRSNRSSCSVATFTPSLAIFPFQFTFLSFLFTSLSNKSQFHGLISNWSLEQSQQPSPPFESVQCRYPDCSRYANEPGRRFDPDFINAPLPPAAPIETIPQLK